MAWLVPEGSRFFISTGFAAAVNATAASNASNAVITATNTYTVGDELLFTSGWEDATDSIWKTSAATGAYVTLGGLDSTDTNFFPSGGGGGTLQKVSNWIELQQPLTIDTSGGDAKFINVEPLNKRNSFQIPTGFNANQTRLTIGYDPTLPGYQAAVAASRTLKKVAFKFVLSGGATVYSYGYITASEAPRMTKGQVLSVEVAISSIGRMVSYAS